MQILSAWTSAYAWGLTCDHRTKITKPNDCSSFLQVCTSDCVWPCLSVCNEYVVGWGKGAYSDELPYAPHVRCLTVFSFIQLQDNHKKTWINLPGSQWLPILPSLVPIPPPPLSGGAKEASLGPVCLQLHLLTVTKQFYHCSSFTYLKVILCIAFKQQYVTVKLFVIQRTTAVTEMSGIKHLSHT